MDKIEYVGLCCSHGSHQKFIKVLKVHFLEWIGSSHMPIASSCAYQRPFLICYLPDIFDTNFTRDGGSKNGFSFSNATVEI